MRELVSVLGIDPGVTTGVALITVPVDSIYGSASAEITEFESTEVSGSIHNQVQGIAYWATKLYNGPCPVIAIEDFDLDPRKYHSRDKNLLAPVRLIGAIEYANDCNHFGNVRLHLQNRALAKSTATDGRLRAWGLYTSGSDHVRDATRQAITIIRRLKGSRDLRREVWGIEYERRAALPAPYSEE